MGATLNLSNLGGVKIKFTPDLDDVVLDEDDMISDSAVHMVTQQSLVAYLAGIAGGLSDPIAYDAATNTPDLDVSPSGISAGDFYYVTVAGAFFAENVEPNDQLIAKQDNPTTLAHWIVSEKNLDQATETVAGFAKLATQALTDGGTDDLTIVTPKKLKDTSQSLADPNADRILFWDDSTGLVAYLEVGTGLDLTGTLLTATVTADGWHGSTTRIKFSPSEVFPLDDQDWKQKIELDGARVTDSGGKITEFGVNFHIPTGFKATHFHVYASSAIVIEIYENDISDGTTADTRGSGNANTEVDMTDVDSTTTNYLTLRMVDAGADIYGGYVTIAAI